jgi:rhodanese-related sulfurtransferase
MAAADLYENLNDGDPENDPYIISLRSAEDYAKGHIPGAVNMGVKELFTPDNLATIPPDRQVVVVCYTGQTAGQATAALNMLSYEAYSLLFGMSSWTTDPEVFTKRFNPEVHAGDYAVDTEAHEPGGPYALPGPLAAGVAGAAEAYFGDGPRTMAAADLYENLNDGDPENDPYIISLRSAEDYAKGHIPGAVNMGVTELFTSDNLATIPPDRQVVVVCYTGQTAGQATAALNMLGYEAYSLLFGMSSWTSDPDVFAKRFNPEVHAGDYTIDTEAHEPGGPYELPFTLTTTAAVGVGGAAEAYFGDGPRTMAAADLYENLNDGDPENDPYIISLRSAEDYAKGHIPGAVNMGVTELFTPDNLATIPPDRQVVVVCYTGQTAGQATAALNMLGYEAYSLLFGMSSWTTDPDIFAKRFNPEVHTSDYTIDIEAHPPGGPYELPFAVTATTAVGVGGAAEAYFGDGPRTMAAADLYENLNDGDPENDPYIISLRSAEDYAKGHIPGAVNMGVTELFTSDNLATIPPDRQVVVVCYTGQTAGQATAALNMLGYEAYSLLFGMSSWTTDPEVFTKRFNPEVHTSDYIIDTEAHQPGGPYELPTSLAAAAPSVGGAPAPVLAPAAEVPATQAEAKNCITCHTDEETLQALAVEEEEEKTSEESSGEG